MVLSAKVQSWRRVADKNPSGFVKERLRIPGPMGVEVNFVYRHGQKQYSLRKQLILKAGVPLRLTELKYRRAGFSSVETAESFAQCYGRDNARIGILAHLESRASELLNNYRAFNASLNTYYPHLKQELSRENLFGIKFEDSKSQVVISSKENPVKIRGDGLHIVHVSEFAHFFAAFDLVMREVAPVVPPVAGSQIILESTGSFVGTAPYNHYYEATPWKEFLDNGYERSWGKNEFVRHFTSWLDDPECIKKFREGKELEQYGKLMEDMNENCPRLYEKCVFYQLSPEQLNWCWNAYTYQGNNDFSYFTREFPFVENDAWLSGGESYFGNHELDMVKTEDPLAIFILDRNNLCKIFEDLTELTQLQPEQSTHLDDYPSYPLIKIWALPKPGEQYVLGSDSAQGYETGDYSAGYMLHKKTREMVASYHGRMRPDEAAHINVSLCRIYNRAMSAPEINPAGGGAEVLNIMQRLGYHYFYVFKVYDHVLGITDTNRLGWYSNSRTRPRMLQELRKLFLDCVKERLMLKGLFRDKGLINEMRKFCVNARTGKAEATEGCFDDRVIALAITHQVCCDELAGGRDDMLKKYHPLSIGEPRKPIDLSQQSKNISKIMTPDKFLQQMTGKKSNFMSNKFELI